MRYQRPKERDGLNPNIARPCHGVRRGKFGHDPWPTKTLIKAIKELRKDSAPGPGAATPKLEGTDSTPVTTNSLAKDGELEET